MGARFTEQLMATGEWSADLDYRADVLADLVDEEGRPRKVHVLAYDADDNLLWCGLLLRAEADRRRISIGGRGPMWWLGFDGDGPIIEDSEYVSGANKLSNGDLGLDDLYWRLGEGWSIAGGVAGSSATAADAALESDEKFPTQAGYEYTASCTESRGTAAGIGRLRIRLVFEGKFAYPDILPSNWDDQSDTPGDASVSGDVITLGPCTPYAPIPNPTFDSALTGWVQVAGTWTQTTSTAYSGTGSATTAAGGPSPKHLQADFDPSSSGTVDPFPWGPNEKWRFEGAVRGDASADGEAKIQLYLADVGWPANPSWMVIARVDGGDSDKTNWRYEQVEITTPENKTHFVPMLVVYGHTAGNWFFDHVKATRIEGNKARVVNLDVAGVVPERKYRWRAKVTCGAAMTGGKLSLGVMLSGTERPILHQESPAVDAAAGEELWVEWSFTPPSGYFVAQTYIVATDALGGSFVVEEQTLVDEDPTTVFIDARSDYVPHAASALSVSYAAPDGSEWVRVAVVAESDADGYAVDDVSLVRDGVTSATGDDIVAELVAGSSIVVGDVDCPEVIPYDWRLLNMTPRDALDYYCQVVSEPRREWRLNPDRTLDVATAGALFTDHAPGGPSEIVLLDDDLDVPGGIPAVEANAEKRATHIKVIGAERATVSGRPMVITAVAAVPGAPEVDWNGNPVVRTRLVSDSSVDHFAYAQALADDLAAAEARPPLAIEATLSGIDTRPAFGVGDWVYVYKPDSGIRDLSNPAVVNGEAVFPRRVRVLGRTRRLGPSHRLVLRRADGSTEDLTGVLWEPEDAVDLELGERRPSFVSDPQGGNVGRQYLRDRASAQR